MDDFMKTEAKDIISTAIEKASGATGINIEVSHHLSSQTSPFFQEISPLLYSLLANS